MADQNKRNLEDRALDFMLHQAFEEISEDEKRRYKELSEGIDIEEITTPKLDKVLKQPQKAKKRKTVLRYSAAVATILLVLFGTHLILYNSVEAYRFQFQRIFMQYNIGEGGFGSIDVANSDEESGILQVTSPVENFPFSSWVPQGYQMETVNAFDEYQGYCEYRNRKEETISLDYVLHENNTLGLDAGDGIFFDTEDSEIEELSIRGNEGISVLRKDFDRIMYTIIWSNENYTLHLYGDFKENTTNYNEILETIAKSITYEQ